MIRRTDRTLVALDLDPLTNPDIGDFGMIAVLESWLLSRARVLQLHRPDTEIGCCPRLTESTDSGELDVLRFRFPTPFARLAGALQLFLAVWAR